MSLSRRELLTASALLLAGPGFALRAAARASAGGGPIVLYWNENPYGPSPAARAAVSAATPGSCRYPDDHMGPLIEALAAREGVGKDQIVTGTGSGELLRALGLLAAQGGGEVIAAEPTFLELPDYAQRNGASVKFVPVDAAKRLDLAAMHAAVSARTRLIYVCNPNNPTSTAVAAADIRALVAALPDHVTTLVDEAYLDFVTAPGVSSVVDLVNGRQRVVVTRTFSKIHGMAGIRCGYAIARPDVAAELAAARMATPNTFAVHAAHASLGDTAFLTDTRRRILASRVRITTELVRLKLPYAEPQGNFVFFDTGMPLKRFTERMRARNILVGRRFPPFENWCRITIGTESEVEAFLAALPAVTGQA
ncbi:MAG TPA: histidinol-phosphate transaminase [Steroidobacteraceae bacterium]|nr:histidinol-phosphate transaminase [Steroidobacteraceae bacterium]